VNGQTHFVRFSHFSPFFSPERTTELKLHRLKKALATVDPTSVDNSERTSLKSAAIETLNQIGKVPGLKGLLNALQHCCLHKTPQESPECND
jgi:hypothetical protein